MGLKWYSMNFNHTKVTQQKFGISLLRSWICLSNNWYVTHQITHQSRGFWPLKVVNFPMKPGISLTTKTGSQTARSCRWNGSFRLRQRCLAWKNPDMFIQYMIYMRYMRYIYIYDLYIYRCLVDPIHNEKSIHQIWFFGATTKNEASQGWFYWSLGRYVLSDFSLWSSTELPSAQALRQSSQQLQQNFLLVKLCPFKISIPVHSMPKESMLVKSKILHLKVLPTIPILMVPEMISKMEDRLAALPPGSHRPWRAVPVAAVARHRPSGAPSGENEKLV